MSLALALILVAGCSDDESGESTTTTAAGETTTTAAACDLSDASLVPPIRFLGPTAGYEEALFESNNIMLENWDSLGLTVETNLLSDVGEIIDTGASRGYDFISFGYGGRLSRIDPDELISRTLLCELAGAGGSNMADYCYTAYDDAVYASKVAVDPAERQVHVYRAQEIQALDVPWLTVYHPSEVYAWNPSKITSVTAAINVGLLNFDNIMTSEPLVEDKILRIGTDNVFRSVNPVTLENIAIDIQIQDLVFSSIAKITFDGRVVEHLGSWEWLDDLTLAVTIREEAVFSDGSPVTGEDVKFSFDYYKQWEVGRYITPLASVDSVEVTGEKTVQINLVEPSAPFEFAALSQILILQKAQWDGMVEREGLSHPEEWTEVNLIGSGPFRVKSISVGEAVELEMNPNFWGTPSNWDGIIVYIFGESQGVFRALQDETIYMHQEGSLAAADVEQVISGAQANLEGGIVGTTAARGGYMRMSAGSPFADYWLRMAIAHTYDKAYAVDVAWRGFAQSGTGTIAPDNAFWHNPNILEVEPPYGEHMTTPHWHQLDVERARQILTDGGYCWDDDGRLHYPSADYVPMVHFDGSAEQYEGE